MRFIRKGEDIGDVVFGTLEEQMKRLLEKDAAEKAVDPPLMLKGDEDPIVYMLGVPVPWRIAQHVPFELVDELARCFIAHTQKMTAHRGLSATSSDDTVEYVARAILGAKLAYGYGIPEDEHRIGTIRELGEDSSHNHGLTEMAKAAIDAVHDVSYAEGYAAGATGYEQERDELIAALLQARREYGAFTSLSGETLIQMDAALTKHSARKLAAPPIPDKD